ncbi:MAG: hypothetical protein K6C36_09970 [Clostridia bacterium]|nr:hypothetical protein [Clostridia bacterium]
MNDNNENRLQYDLEEDYRRAMASPQKGSQMRFERTAPRRFVDPYEQHEAAPAKPEPAPAQSESTPGAGKKKLFDRKNRRRADATEAVPVVDVSAVEGGKPRTVRHESAPPARPAGPKRRTETAPERRPAAQRPVPEKPIRPAAPETDAAAGAPAKEKTPARSSRTDGSGRRSAEGTSVQKPVRLFGAAKRAACVVFVIVMLFGFIFAGRFWARPKTSVVENRDLAKFPSFSFSSLFNGSFFDGVSEWFSDTFPSRDALISLNSKLKSFLGLKANIFKLEEGNRGDDIPDAPMTTQPPAEESTDAPVPAETTAPPETTSPAMTTVKSDNMDTQALSSIFIAGNAGYEYYNFVQGTADAYISAVNSLGSALSAKSPGTKLYSVVIPTSMDITLDPEIRAQVGSSDQRKAISYIENSLSDNVTKVDIFDVLKSHSGEYVYYRTDHHWSSLGAYYGYAELMKAMGKTPRAIGDYTEKVYEGFLGSFYRDSGQSPALAKAPDSIVVYEPPVETSFYMEYNGEMIYWPLIANPDTYHDATLKYSCFAGADCPYGEITNKEKSDGSACVLVKESFGNVFAPFLAEHFNHVYLIDYRYWSGSAISGSSIAGFAAEKGAEAVVLLNNVSMTRNASLVDKLAAVAR